MHFDICDQTEDRLVLEGELNADEPAFSGHFPQASLLPGVVQVDWAMQRQPWYSVDRFVRIDRLKFMQVTPPGIRLVLALEHKGDGRVNFEYRCGEHITSSGVLVFGCE